MSVKWLLPCSTAPISEARAYAIDSFDHTMDYEGWEDQHNKMERLTYGKFAQLWLYEFCRLNEIDCDKDRSGPRDPDDTDLVICGQDVDVKTSTITGLIGQISPGMYKKKTGFYCFLLTDRNCSFIRPVGFLHCSQFEAYSKEVRKGEQIPGTKIEQRFSSSRFLVKGTPYIPFFDFMLDARKQDLEKHARPLRAAS